MSDFRPEIEVGRDRRDLLGVPGSSFPPGPGGVSLSHRKEQKGPRALPRHPNRGGTGPLGTWDFIKENDDFIKDL